MSDLLASLHRHRQAILALLMIAVVAALLWTARGALPAFFIGLALVFILDPAVTFLSRRGVPRWAAVIVMYVAVVAVIWGLVAYALPPISRQTPPRAGSAARSQSTRTHVRTQEVQIPMRSPTW